MNKVLLLILLLYGAVDCQWQAIAADTETDGNIITGLDISDSVVPADLDHLVAALASAISSGPVLESIRGGIHGRIGFSVFAWHHNRYTYVDWMLIASDEDAKVAASMIKRRILVNAEPRTSDNEKRFPGSRTDLSRAIDYAGSYLDKAPYSTQKRIVNIIGNGIDNVGETAGPARDRFILTGGTINGVVFGDDSSVRTYYRRQVVGGPGAFVVTLADGHDLVDAFTRKFLSDIALLRGKGVAVQR